MKSLYEPAAVAEVKQRIGTLGPQSQRLWGKMNVAQMLAHCATDIEALVDHKPHPRGFLGRTIGPLFRSAYSNDKPMSKNSPTVSTLIINNDRDFAIERDRLFTLIDRFAAGGPEGCSKEPHCFFGHLTAEEWGKGMYKHLDHHLRQFGA